MYACRVITCSRVYINPCCQSCSWLAVYTGERTVASVHVGYKQPHTLSTHTQTGLGTSVCTHTPNYKDTPVHGQTEASVYTTCVAQAIHDKYCTDTSTTCEPKHADLRTIRASPRLSIPNTLYKDSAYVQAQALIVYTAYAPPRLSMS